MKTKIIHKIAGFILMALLVPGVAFLSATTAQAGGRTSARGATNSTCASRNEQRNYDTQTKFSANAPICLTSRTTQSSSET
jgi:hypothetical protein